MKINYQYFEALLQSQLIVVQILFLIFQIIRMQSEVFSSKLQFYIEYKRIKFKKKKLYLILKDIKIWVIIQKFNIFL
jgi:hypothetical protein